MRSVGPVGGVALIVLCSVVLASVSLFLRSETTFAIVEKLNVNDLTLQSDAIVVGTVTNTRSLWQNGRIHTDVTISVEQTVKGGSFYPEITLRQPGGEADGIREWVEDAPPFAVGERAVLFLRRAGPAAFEMTGAFQGKLAVENDKVFLEGEYVPLSTLLSRVSSILQGGQPQQPATPAEPSAEACTISSVYPASASAGTGSKVGIAGSGFDSAGTVKFFWQTVQGTDQWKTATSGPWQATLIPDVVVPEGASSGPVLVEPASTGACQAAFSVTFGFWPPKWADLHPNVTIEINPNTADTPNEKAAVQAAEDTWNGVASFSFVRGPNSSATAASNNGHNEVMWRTGMPSTTLAETTCWSGAATVECDVEFNDDWTWYADGNPGSGQVDVQSIALHELGHVANLNDLYGTADAPKVMYGYGDACIGGTKRVLQSDDRTGIRWIYPSAVGGIAEYPQLEPGAAASAHGSSAPNAFALGGLATGGALLLAAGGWYAKRRWRAG